MVQNRAFGLASAANGKAREILLLKYSNGEIVGRVSHGSGPYWYQEAMGRPMPKKVVVRFTASGKEQQIVVPTNLPRDFQGDALFVLFHSPEEGFSVKIFHGEWKGLQGRKLEEIDPSLRGRIDRRINLNVILLTDSSRPLRAVECDLGQDGRASRATLGAGEVVHVASRHVTESPYSVKLTFLDALGEEWGFLAGFETERGNILAQWGKPAFPARTGRVPAQKAEGASPVFGGDLVILIHEAKRGYRWEAGEYQVLMFAGCLGQFACFPSGLELLLHLRGLASAPQGRWHKLQFPLRPADPKRLELLFCAPPPAP